ncbi:MAG: O-antigen ligase family protein [Bacteroidetes bacterium]|nr:O-antigen ligase family protein [Bacteroidota bacterium]
MKNLRENLCFTCCLAIIVGLLSSRFLMTVGMIVLIANGVFNPAIKSNFRNFLSNKPMIIISSLFILYLLSGIYSENFSFLLERLRIKLPFLFLPFAFCAMPRFSEKKYHGLFYCFFMLIFLSSLATFIYYLLDLKTINDAYKYAKVLPTHINHIRYSLMVCFAIIIGIHLYYKGFYLKYKFEKKLILVGTLFLVMFIHLLSVRSGLVALYLTLIYLIVRYVFYHKKFIAGIALIVLICALPITAYHTLPTFKNKVGYVIYDLNLYLKKDAPSNLSDSDRLRSMKVGLNVGNKNPIIGVGIGDLKDEMDKIYAKDFPFLEQEKWLIPHNQFIVYYAGIGLIGLFIATFIFFYPWVYKKNYKDTLFTSLHLIIFTSFLTEATIEVQIGTTFYILFLLLGLKQVKSIK